MIIENDKGQSAIDYVTDDRKQWVGTIIDNHKGKSIFGKILFQIVIANDILAFNLRISDALFRKYVLKKNSQNNKSLSNCRLFQKFMCVKLLKININKVKSRYITPVANVSATNLRNLEL